MLQGTLTCSQSNVPSGVFCCDAGSFCCDDRSLTATQGSSPFATVQRMKTLHTLCDSTCAHPANPFPNLKQFHHKWKIFTIKKAQAGAPDCVSL